MPIVKSFQALPSTTLTGSYQASIWHPVGSENQLTLAVRYTMGAAETANSIQLKVETSDDESASAVAYQETTQTVSGGTVTRALAEHTFTATQAAGTYDNFTINTPVNAKFFRVSVKETGIASNGGTANIKAFINYV